MQAEELLYLAHSKQASDIHITVNSPIIFRIHGELKPINDVLLKPSETLELAKQFMTDERYEALQQNGDVDFSYGVAGLARFRINAYKQRGSVGLAIRIVPSRIPSMEELRLPPIAAEFAKKPQGLMLVTGPTGSGKSTTLASIIDHLNKTENAHIITLEDPIEFIYDHKKSMVNQREVGLDTPSFSHGLRAALRQDPDIVLVGELRDLETISTAISAAETGHLVFGTLHTADAPQTIDRIIDVFPPAMQAQIRIQLAAVLLGVISQRLLPKSDGRGRIAAFEVLVNTPAVANLIRTEKIFQIRSVMQTNKALGMQTMEYALRELVQQGQIKLEDAREALFGFGEL
ncbi:MULTISPECIES: type IV pilus twitching motility protein PilT [Bacillales]|uniref:type IV pilus twitching motility protein PilT n=1 Tax=Bacillales TaxID=1385 RepID=UPI0006A7A7FA|nr:MULTISPECIES: type IV pilus twitching motility protein PilT [Bacillales]OBZ12975.1 type IV pili twitching motility protein PilT [Bacillus sp. FJAT-26390]